MSATNVIAALDIGNAYTRCVIGEISSRGTIQVLGKSKVPSEGMRRGLVVDKDPCSSAVKDAIRMAEQRAGRTVKELVVALSSQSASVQSTRGTVSITGRGNEVTEDDVDRVLQVAKGVALSSEAETLDIFPEEYIVDGYDNLLDPVGMIGSRLSVEATLVLGQSRVLSLIRSVIENAGYRISGFAFKPLVLGSLIQNEAERQSAVAVLEIGAGLSEVALFRTGALRKVGSVPLGGMSITNDISLGLKVSHPVAEKIKLELNVLSEDSRDKDVDLVDYGHHTAKKVRASHLAEIIGCRVEEIFVLLLREINKLAGDNPPDSVIITGGVAQSKGVETLVRRVFKGKVRLVTAPLGEMDDPGYNNLVALLSFKARELAASHAPQEAHPGKKSGVVVRFAGWLKEFWE